MRPQMEGLYHSNMCRNLNLDIDTRHRTIFLPDLAIKINFMKWWTYFKQIILTLLFPHFCTGCNRIGTYLCDNCYSKIHFFGSQIEITLENPALDTLLSAAHYQPPLSNLIKEMKYQRVQNLAQVAADILYWSVNIPHTDLITAVPLHPKRHQERGFNQAAAIAVHLSNLLQVPYQPLLLRTQNTPHQASISDRQHRLTHLQNCFEINIPIFSKLKNCPQKVLLIDDVTTTGTTLNECAHILKNHGVKKVIGLTLGHGS